MDYLDVRRYDPDDDAHRRLAELSREAHRLAANDQDTTETQREIDRQAALLWSLGTDELAAITARP